MVGVSLALQLASCCRQTRPFCWWRAFPMPAEIRQRHRIIIRRLTPAPPRLSYSSRLIYERDAGCGRVCTSGCARSRAFTFPSRGRFGSTLLKAGDHDWPALGYVVENAWLGKALVQQLHRQGRVEVRSPAKVEKATLSDVRVSACNWTARQSDINAELLLVADGAGSRLREALGCRGERKTLPAACSGGQCGFLRAASKLCLRAFYR